MENYWNVNNDGVLTINADLYIKENGNCVLPIATNQPWLAEYNETDITIIEFVGEGLAFPENASYWFNDYFNVTEIVGLENVSTRNVTNMAGMFYNMESLKKIDLSNFDTRNVTDMSSMFEGMYSLTELDVSNFNTRKVKNMSYMFYNIQNLKELDVSSFDTSNVTDMRYMFAHCKKMAELDLTNFDTSNVTNVEGMFLGVPNSTKEYTEKTKEIDDIEADAENDKKTKPSYYKLKNIEVFDFIDEFELNFNIGNVAKYIARYQNKNGLEDLKKAEVYLKREINKLKKGDCK